MKIPVIALFIIFYACSCVIPESNHVEPQYHLLTKTLPDENQTLAMPAVSFHVREVNVPPYLDDNRLVNRPGNSSIKYLENHRWGEPLGEGISRVIGLNLSSILNTLDYSSYPQRLKAGCHYEVAVSVQRFEKAENEQVKLSAIIEIFHRNRIVRQVQFYKSISIKGRNISDEIDALTFALSSASFQIAKTIYSLPMSLALRIDAGEVIWEDSTLVQVTKFLNEILANHSKQENTIKISMGNNLTNHQLPLISLHSQNKSLYEVINQVRDHLGITVDYTPSGIIFSSLQ